jgi:hypothetical protein
MRGERAEASEARQGATGRLGRPRCAARKQDET